MSLEYRDLPIALARFKRASQLCPHNVLAWAALTATHLFGTRAIVFYHLKRRIFGAR